MSQNLLSSQRVASSVVRATRRTIAGAGLSAAGLRLISPPTADAKSQLTRNQVISSYANTTPIHITHPNGAGLTANPYPSTVAVSGLSDPVTFDLKVTLHGLTHPQPEDLMVALTSPSGEFMYLLTGAGGTHAVSGLDIALDSRSPQRLVEGAQLTAGSYQPQCFLAGSNTFPAPGPRFNGNIWCTYQYIMYPSPLGTWKLWVHDVSGTHEGQIAGGWELQVTARADIQVKKKKKKKH